MMISLLDSLKKLDMRNMAALELENLDSLLAIPCSQQTKEANAAIKKITDDQWAIFNNKNLTADQRNSALDIIAKIHKYYGWKDVSTYRIRKGSGSRPATAEERAKNCDDFLKYLETKGWKKDFPEYELVKLIATVWGPVK